jgi:hypothetical protein
MAMAISTYQLNNGDSWINNYCTAVCSSATTIISGVRWTEGDAIVPDDDGSHEDDEDDDIEPELVWGEAAPNLTDGYCDDVNCTECRESWYEDTPEAKSYRCKDETIFAYRDKCLEETLKEEGMNLCMTGED